MTQDKLYVAIAQIEEYIDKGFSLLGYYRIVKKSGLYNKFKLLYDSLPQELMDNRDYLSRQKEENIFTLLNKVSFMLEQSKTFLGYMIVNVNTIMISLEEMYASLPEDIKMCRGDDNIIEHNAESIEIPDFLKK